MDEEGEEDGEAEARVGVVGGVGDEAFGEFVEGYGDGGLEADGEEGVLGDVVVVQVRGCGCGVGGGGCFVGVGFVEVVVRMVVVGGGEGLGACHVRVGGAGGEVALVVGGVVAGGDVIGRAI